MWFTWCKSKEGNLVPAGEPHQKENIFTFETPKKLSGKCDLFLQRTFLLCSNKIDIFFVFYFFLMFKNCPFFPNNSEV